MNPAQINVLSLMSYIDTEQEQQELQDILLQFYRKKTDSLLLQFQREHNVTQQTLDEWSNMHERTPDRHFSELRHYDFPKVDVRTLTEFLGIVRTL